MRILGSDKLIFFATFIFLCKIPQENGEVTLIRCTYTLIVL